MSNLVSLDGVYMGCYLYPCSKLTFGIKKYKGGKFCGISLPHQTIEFFILYISWIESESCSIPDRERESTKSELLTDYLVDGPQIRHGG